MLNRVALAGSDLPRRLLFALAIIVVPLLALTAVHLYEATERPAELARDRAQIARTLQVIELSERLRATAQNAERAQRGYLLTGAPPYLDAYAALVQGARSTLARLQELTADNPEQRRTMPLLGSALEAWLSARQEAIDVDEHQGHAAAQKLVASHAGIDTLRDVDRHLDAAIAAEHELLAARQSQAAQDEDRIRQVALGTGLVDVILLALGVSLTIGAFRRARLLERQRLEHEQRMSTQLLEAQAALAQMQKVEALGQLTGGVAHDFNNWLHVIKNAADIVQRRLRTSDPEISQYLDMIKRNTDRAAGTTSRLLAFARQQPLTPKPSDINELVAGMAELLRSTLGEHVSLEFFGGADLWAVAVDQNQLETSILNLAVNARDAMPHNGKLAIETANALLDEPYARLHADVRPGQYVMVAVSDTGIGMTNEIARRVFEPFFTTKPSGRGTGLGLSQVFGFVKQSGGHVKIYSEPGQGTTVKMYFPRLLRGNMGQAPESLASERSGCGESILVVEDNEDVRTFTAQVLGQLGYRVTVAPDGRLALSVLDQLSGVDLLFTDLGLPGGMTGRELAEEARRRWPSVKVLYTTGYARNSIVHHGRLDVGVELITKPFTESSLASKIRTVLDKSANATR